MKTKCEVQKETQIAEMYGTAGMPDLLPPAECDLRPTGIEARRNGPATHPPPQRIQRAPKLGQIGRSRRVVIDDEDLDDIMNNNRSFPVSISVSPLA
ncbi:uncharacterized protein si:dkey-112a7.4 [Hoplias malabaricus]|uniref:uncharacterized protein si:dkey-112a7.4 n=1 Tax=Hoplias malabaricus TaxID=27720 RepID=UPI003461D305